MDWIFSPIAQAALFEWEQFFADWSLLIALGFLAFELTRYAVMKRFSWELAGDTLTNFITQVFYVGLGPIVYGALTIFVFYFVYQYAIFDIETNWATLAICVVLADLVYYWEHRFLHRVAMGWATHTVHHSSPNFNISVAYRFGPMDAFWPIFSHVPLVLLGFSPIVVLFAAAFVLLYQLILHTEAIGKLPRFIEFVMNTPSHHRVHHGANPEYIDKNYGGIFIIWDRIFGTFAEEKRPVIFGVTEPINSVNPFTVFLHGLVRLWRQVRRTRGLANKLAVLVKPPGWEPVPGDAGKSAGGEA